MNGKISRRDPASRFSREKAFRNLTDVLRARGSLAPREEIWEAVADADHMGEIGFAAAVDWLTSVAERIEEKWPAAKARHWDNWQLGYVD